jgi:DUF4097 and DUF4098 domain-containing protein YvlB
MKWISIIMAAACLPALGATEERLNKRFAAQPGGALVVDVDFGSIKVRTNATSEVAVDVWRKVSRKTKAEEEQFLKDSPVEFIQEGSMLTVRSHSPKKAGWFSSWRTKTEGKYTITVPSRFSARVQSGGGGVDAADLTGEFQLRTGGGGVEATQLRGPLNGSSGGGGVRAQNCEGVLRLDTGGGGIDVSGGSGSLDARSGGGGVTVKVFHGPVHAQTGGGGLYFERIEGDLEGTTGGGGIRALAPSELAWSVNLSTGGGGIDFSVPAGAAFQLDAKTGGGSVHCDLPVTISGKPNSSHLQGPVNGGGKSVVLHTGGGGIHIQKL